MLTWKIGSLQIEANLDRNVWETGTPEKAGFRSNPLEKQ
jgi:hypothetical protein